MIPRALFLLLAVSAALRAADTDALRANFATPPGDARPWTWWHWMNGNVTREGITADLEAMKRGGLGGAEMFDIGAGIPPGPVAYMSSDWLALTKYAASEAQRLGLRLGIHNSSGWSSSGGPWVTPEQAMQVLVSSEVAVSGGRHLELALPEPERVLGFYRDVAVLAFPRSSQGLPGLHEVKVKATSSAPHFEPDKILDGNVDTTVTLPAPKPGAPQYIQLEFERPFLARALSLDPGSSHHGFTGELQVSDDGAGFRKIRGYWLRHARGRRTFSFPAVTAKYYRMVFTEPGRDSYVDWRLADMDLSPEAKIDDFEQKAGYQPYPPEPPADTGIDSADDVVDPAKVVDLTSRLTADGHLVWDAPPGEWTILRLGHTPLKGDGNRNNPASFAGGGLECDKLDAQIVRKFWDGGMANVMKELGPLVGTTLTDVLIDSYERGQPNWTERFPEQFKRLRGYDMKSYLPAMTGRIMQSREISERFLWDVRRTIAELFATQYAGTFSELAHEHRLQFGLEAAGFVADQLEYLGRSDMPIAVFWIERDPPSLYMQTAAAQAYGHNLVGGEALTAKPEDSKWMRDPASVKAVGDAAFCAGVNRFLIHTFAHQPWLNRAPGMTAGPWGVHFDRNNTWWDEGRDWRVYLTRCQYVLQQGIPVADGFFFSGESPPVAMSIKPGLPAGYQGVGVNAEVILQRLSVKDGRLVLPDGLSAPFLSMGEQRYYSLAVLRRLRELVNAGATIVGPKPIRSLGLTDYPSGDLEFKSIADELWGNLDGKATTSRQVGRGSVLWLSEGRQIVAKLGLIPDFVGSVPSGSAALRSTHRKLPDADIYFVSNQADQSVEASALFRTSSRRPELWDAETGTMRVAPVYSEENGRTKVALALPAHGSIFVVFPQSETVEQEHAVSFKTSFGSGNLMIAAGRMVIEASAAGTWELHSTSNRSARGSVPEIPASTTLAGPWTVTFPPGLGAPAKITLPELISWTEHAEPGVKYFSGTATYQTGFKVSADQLETGRRLYLDLGMVKNLANVTLNGHGLGVLWKAPFRLDITDTAKVGENDLVIRLTNLWPNRLIGDEQLLADVEWLPTGAIKAWPDWFRQGKPSPSGRVTFTTWHHWKKDDALLPSGLLGPVRLQSTVRIAVPPIGEWR